MARTGKGPCQQPSVPSPAPLPPRLRKEPIVWLFVWAPGSPPPRRASEEGSLPAGRAIVLCIPLRRASCGGAQPAPSRMPSRAPAQAALWGWPRALEGFQVGGRQATLLRARASAVLQEAEDAQEDAPLDDQVEGGPAPRLAAGRSVSHHSSANAASSAPWRAAGCRGVLFMPLGAPTFAWFSASRTTTSKRPLQAARCRGVQPCRLGSSKPAPPLSSASQARHLPLVAAVCSGQGHQEPPHYSAGAGWPSLGLSTARGRGVLRFLCWPPARPPGPSAA